MEKKSIVTMIFMGTVFLILLGFVLMHHHFKESQKKYEHEHAVVDSTLLYGDIIINYKHTAKYSKLSGVLLDTMGRFHDVTKRGSGYYYKKYNINVGDTIHNQKLWQYTLRNGDIIIQGFDESNY